MFQIRGISTSTYTSMLPRIFIGGILCVWGQLIITPWVSCHTKNMARVRHPTIQRHKKSYSLYRWMPPLFFFQIFGAKKLPQTLKKPVRTAFVSPKIGNMNWAE